MFNLKIFPSQIWKQLKQCSKLQKEASCVLRQLKGKLEPNSFVFVEHSEIASWDEMGKTVIPIKVELQGKQQYQIQNLLYLEQIIQMCPRPKC